MKFYVTTLPFSNYDTQAVRLFAVFADRRYAILDMTREQWLGAMAGVSQGGRYLAFDSQMFDASTRTSHSEFYARLFPEPVQLNTYEINLLYTNNNYYMEKLFNLIANQLDYYRTRRLRNIYAERSNRLSFTGSTPKHIVYKGRTYNCNNDEYDMVRYNKARANYKLLKSAFNQLLSGEEDDAREWCDVFMDLYSADRSRHDYLVTAFEKCREVLASKHLDGTLTIAIADTCGHIEYINEMHSDLGSSGDEQVCDRCFGDNYVYVEDHSEYWDRENEEVYYHESRDAYYSYAEDDYDDNDDDDRDPGDPNYLMDYATNVLRVLEPDHKLISSTHGDFRMGIEFEMTSGRDKYRDDAVTNVRQQLGTEYCVCKSDGSLPDNGLEIVTAPRGLAEHIKRFKNWDIDPSYRAWDVGTCGMHIHVHSKAFSPLVFGKFVMFINCEENTDFIRKIAGRHPRKDRQAQSYCQVEGEEALQNPSKAVKGKGGDRYYMINTQNLSRAERDRLQINKHCYTNGKDYDTVELRIFRASLKKERLLAQIEFTHASVMFCRVASWKHLDKMHFIEWLKTTDNVYPHLSDWYGVRRRAKKQETLVHPTSAPLENSCADTPDSTSV